MSFILDALRKSESERQRNQRPATANLQVQNARRGSGIWLPLVALLVGVNLSLLLVMWIMSEPDTSSAPENSAGVPTEMPETIPPADDRAQSPRRLSEEAIAPVTTPPAAESAPAAETPEAPATNIYAANADDEFENLPSLEELVLQNAITVPPLRLDIHVYSDDPSERFVFVNMARYNEGNTLSEGPKLMAITPAGIVLRFQGQEFLVTRE